MKIVLIALFGLLLTGCGIDFKTNADAIDTLQQLPMSPDDPNVSDEFADVNYEQLEQALNRFAPSNGSSRGFFGRRRTSFQPLRNLFTLLRSGEAHTTSSLADGLVEMNGGNVQHTASGLSGILDIIKAIGPFISTLIPGLGPIIDALLKILPAIISIFG